MLSEIYKAHQQEQNERRLEQERKRKQAIKSAQEVSSGFVDALNSGVEEAYENQKKINLLVKDLQIQSTVFLKQASQWINTVEGFNASLKELGDLPNWASIIEKDMLLICRSLEYAYNGPAVDITDSPIPEHVIPVDTPPISPIANLVKEPGSGAGEEFRPETPPKQSS
ncbi:Biogenesis of lysosome-related organelles complex 1 subunit 1-like [Oopsacas minuta]|uniref:Biogenesis of lysosome-related organelles complex 1 subunit 1 n=1 Tax=Oopsacas minuta TaxID=111878 RepID=A0AAV7JTC3_9METZ|nr:Biogenesis of lysosome-related organelles complex 1 subunit 1-like [Oopsacas minuta]